MISGMLNLDVIPKGRKIPQGRQRQQLPVGNAAVRLTPPVTARKYLEPF
jgi:hypothetical protein